MFYSKYICKSYKQQVQITPFNIEYRICIVFHPKIVGFASIITRRRGLQFVLRLKINKIKIVENMMISKNSK